MMGKLDTRRFAIGMRVSWKGQDYELVAAEPYVRRGRGPQSHPSMARSLPHFGAEFLALTPQRALRQPRRHCPLHVRRRGRNISKGGKLLTERRQLE